MTKFEAISASLYPYDVDPFLKEKACIDEGIDAQADYTATDKVSVAKAAIAILRNLIVLLSESNGGYSLSYDTDGLKERIFKLAKDNGLTDIADEFDTRSKIIDISDQW
jgi:hypothetical protein